MLSALAEKVVVTEQGKRKRKRGSKLDIITAWHENSKLHRLRSKA